jgi:hypothetical protein
MRNPGRQIVIRKIGIQLAPCPRHGVQAQIKQRQQQRAALQPTDEGMILNATILDAMIMDRVTIEYEHYSSSQDLREIIVTGLSLRVIDRGEPQTRLGC